METYKIQILKGSEIIAISNAIRNEKDETEFINLHFPKMTMIRQIKENWRIERICKKSN